MGTSSQAPYVGASFQAPHCLRIEISGCWLSINVKIMILCDIHQHVLDINMKLLVSFVKHLVKNDHLFLHSKNISFSPTWFLYLCVLKITP